MTDPTVFAMFGTLLLLGAWATLPVRAWWLRRSYRRIVLNRLMTVCAKGGR